MNRRGIITGGIAAAALLGAGLNACSGQTASVNFRVIVTVEVDGERVEASNVYGVWHKRVSNDPMGMRGGTEEEYGEAMVLSLKGRKTVYVLPSEQQDGRISYGVYPGIFRYTYGVERGLGSLTDEDYDMMRKASGRRPINYGSTHIDGVRRQLLFVAFADEQIPNTVFQVDAYDMAATLGPGVNLVSIELEVTKEPVTTGQIVKRLPWLVHGHPMANKFNRDKPGQLRAARDTPIDYALGNGSFFSPGSRQ
jgi:hypothetical protein